MAIYWLTNDKVKGSNSLPYLLPSFLHLLAAEHADPPRPDGSDRDRDSDGMTGFVFKIRMHCYTVHLISIFSIASLG